jgi:hypothetical protein
MSGYLPTDVVLGSLALINLRPKEINGFSIYLKVIEEIAAVTKQTMMYQIPKFRKEAYLTAIVPPK